MATYLELHDQYGNGDLLAKISTAVVVVALEINDELVSVDNHANRLVWAKGAFSSPMATARSILPAVLAANKGATVAQINDATDVAIQNNVDAVVDLFADGV